METCPRCADKLTREDSRHMKSTWQVDRNGVVVSCHLKVTAMSGAFCPGCFFQEVISFDQSESVYPFPCWLVMMEAAKSPR